MSAPRGFDAAGLRERLNVACPSFLHRKAFGEAHGLAYDALNDAALGRPENADATLSLCAALKLDPVTMRRAAKTMPAFGGRVLWKTFGCALAVGRQVEGHAQRRVEQISGASLATVCRAEEGRALSIESYVRLCRYLGRHPHFWTASAVTLAAIERLGEALTHDRAAERIASAKTEIAALGVFHGANASRETR